MIKDSNELSFCNKRTNRNSNLSKHGLSGKRQKSKEHPFDDYLRYSYNLDINELFESVAVTQNS